MLWIQTINIEYPVIVSSSAMQSEAAIQRQFSKQNSKFTVRMESNPPRQPSRETVLPKNPCDQLIKKKLARLQGHKGKLSVTHQVNSKVIGETHITYMITVRLK